MLLEVKSMDGTAEQNSHAAEETETAKPKQRGRRYRPRRTTADRVREALLILAEGKANLLTHDEKPWASITFTGARHQLMLDFDGIEACKAGERFIAALPDHEFAIPGQLVADAAIAEVESSYTPEPRMVVTAVLLLLEES